MIHENVLPDGTVVTYPGLRIVQESNTRFHLFIWQPDSRDQHLPIQEQRGWDQWASLMIPVGMSKEDLSEKIYKRIEFMLIHELKENLRIDGDIVIEAHPHGLKPGSRKIQGRRQGLYLDVLLQERG